uniref:Thiamine biosynthesis protein S n=1 Tax=Rhodogorgon sp. TaxID=2485824 RepID=A0A3G3MHU7_9FLOR|nr:thiamine biosynthesis protein S [Rhodogorgon sp.]
MCINYITIQLNGEPLNCFSTMSLKDILKYLDFQLDLVVIEYNSRIIQLNDLDHILLSSGDIVEVLTIVGGG